MRPTLILVALSALGCLVLTAAASAAPVCTLLMEAESGAVLQQQGAHCENRETPASTFKLALAVIGYDAGVLIDEHTPTWPYKEEYAASLESWKKSTDPSSWLRDSVVWYSREITRRLGLERLQNYVDRFDYGNRDLSGDPGLNNGLTNAWLSSSLKISPVEQIRFIGKLLRHQFAVSPAATDRAMAIVPRFALADGWIAAGKTGNGFQRSADGKLDQDRQTGWFVGWAEKGSWQILFARLLQDDVRTDGYASLRARDGLLAELPQLLPPH